MLQGETIAGQGSVAGPRRRESLLSQAPPGLLDYLRRTLVSVDGEAREPELPTHVILDDLGKARLTPFVLEQLYSLIDRASTGGASLIVTSNLSPDRLAARLGDWGDAVLSRVVALRVVEVKGSDHRVAPLERSAAC